MDEEDKTLIICVLCAFMCVVMAFIGSYYDLLRFKKCYENNFRYNYCKQYRNY